MLTTYVSGRDKDLMPGIMMRHVKMIPRSRYLVCLLRLVTEIDPARGLDL